MPKTCCAVGCQNHNMMLKQLSFHKFPREEKRYSLWLTALKRNKPDGTPWVPTTNSVICGEHFINGKPSNDPTHPDYVPSLFDYNKNQSTDNRSQQKINRYRNALKRKSQSDTPTLNYGSVPKHQKLSPKVCKKLFPENDTENIQPIYYAEPLKPQKPSPTGFNKPVSHSERELFFDEIQHLREEKERLIEQNQRLQDQLAAANLSSMLIVNNDNKCKYFTGLSYSVFLSIFTFLSQFLPRTALSDTFSLRDQMFTTLIKLRLDLPFEYMAYHRGVAVSTIHDIFWRWIDLFHAKLDFLVHWPDRETISKTTPSIFKVRFPRLTAIVDCFEIFIERPKNLKARAKVYSNYKKHPTVKFFISCNPLGSVTFLSNAWGGRVSDNELVRSCGFISHNYHLPGDQILADRGFQLKDDFASQCSAELITPAFTKGQSQLSAQDVESSRKLSNVRIHIERVIGLLKNRYTILKGVLPIVLVKSLNDEVEEPNFSSIDKIVRTCASLTNLGDGIVYSED